MLFFYRAMSALFSLLLPRLLVCLSPSYHSLFNSIRRRLLLYSCILNYLVAKAIFNVLTITPHPRRSKTSKAALA